MKNLNFGTTFGIYAQFENSGVEAVRNKQYYGVFAKKGTTHNPESKEGFKLLGYFETFADAHAFTMFLFAEKSLETSVQKYNPSLNA